MSTWSTNLLVATLAFATACLDRTIQDSDGDGIPDDRDNCPNFANADQFDSQNDGTGDVCSECEDPSGVDLDNDGYDDKCDRCIGPGPTGIDADGDGLDDGCDPCLGGTGITGVSENLGGVGTTGSDLNGDNIDDGCTVCFDPSGIDSDNDFLDDKCDACPFGPPHDEDGDLIDDDCDNCPSHPNPAQMTAGDMLGVECDPGPRAHARVLFDGFLFETTSWESVGPGWSIDSDTARAIGETSRTSNARLVPIEVWSVETELEFVMMNPGDFAGIQLTAPPQIELECQVDSGGAVSINHSPFAGPNQTATAPGTVDLGKPVRLRLTQADEADLSPQWTCEAAQDGVFVTRVAINQNNLIQWSPGLFGRGDARFRWIEAISGI